MTVDEISEVLGCEPVMGYFLWKRGHMEVMCPSGEGSIICYRHVGDREKQVRTIMSKIEDLREWAHCVGWHEEVRNDS